MTDKTINDKAVLILLFAVAFGFFSWIFFESIEFPINEDAITTVKPLVGFFNRSSFAEGYQALTSQQAEHRLLPSRLAALLSIFLFDHLNFAFVYMVGGALVLAFIWLIYQDQLKSGTGKPIDLLFYALLILNPSYRTGTFAIWGISNFTSIVFPAVAMVLMHKKSWMGFAGFQVFSFLSINSQGNGTLVPVFGAFYFLFDAHGKDLRRLLIHLLLSVVMLVVYFYQFYLFNYQAIYQRFFDHPAESILFYGFAIISWLGQWVLVRDSILHDYIYLGVLISRFVGISIIIIFGYFLFKNYRQIVSRYSIRFYIFLYTLGTIVGASWDRSLIAAYIQNSTDTLALGFVLDSRFSFYSICLFLLIYSLMISVIRQQALTASIPKNRIRVLPALALALGLLFCAARYIDSLPDMEVEKSHQQICLKMWQQHIDDRRPCRRHKTVVEAMKAAEQQGWLDVSERSKTGASQ